MNTENKSLCFIGGMLVAYFTGLAMTVLSIRGRMSAEEYAKLCKRTK